MLQDITPNRWRRIELLLDEVLDLPPEERARHLDAACGADTELRAAIERLMAADEQMERFEGRGRSSDGNSAAAIIGHLSRGALATLELDLASQVQRALGDAYRIERELPPGGMGRLFLATEVSIGRAVVIKVLPPELANMATAARFRREMEVAARLQHPHIVPVLHVPPRDELLMYVMPYVAGESLRSQLSKGGPFTVVRALRLLREVADALAYAHGEGVVHRDVKPENILLAGDHALLADFGVARGIAGEEGRLTATGESLGTPGYMAPEQISGSAQIDGRADIFALAVVGYEMLAGARPFGAAEPMEEVAAQLSTAPSTLLRKRSEVPRAVSDAIQRALSARPEARFQTAEEFRDALLAPSSSVTAPRRARTIGATALVAALLLLAIVAWPRTRTPADNPRNSFIVFPFRSTLGDSAAWLQQAASNLIGFSLSHWQELRVFDDERTASLLRRAGMSDPDTIDFAAAQRIARQAGVGTMILGDISRERDSLVITAKVHEVRSGERIATEIVRGAVSIDPRALFDSVVTRLLRLSNVTGGVPSDVVAQTTRSLEAYRAYLEATERMYREGGAGAIPLLEKAIALDSSFALAYVQLANAESRRYAGGDSLRRRALVVRASQLGAKLPGRARLLIDLQIAMHERRFTQARALGAKLVALDSTDAEAWYWRAEVEMRSGPRTVPRVDSLGDLARQVRYRRRSIELDSAYVGNYFPLVRALIACASPNAPWVCSADSTIHGDPAQLRARLGARTVDSVRNAAGEQILPTVRQWLGRTNIAGPHRTATYLLLFIGAVNEADASLTKFRLLGGDSLIAAFHEMHVRMSQHRISEAATIAARLLTVPAEEMDARILPYEPRLKNIAVAYLAAAGRFAEAQAFLKEVTDPARMPTTSGDTVRLPPALRRVFVERTLGASYTADGRAARESLRNFYSALRNEFASERSIMPSLVTGTPAPVVAYAHSRDTVILHDWIAAVDDAPSRGAEAIIRLARGDTAGARALGSRFFDPTPASAQALLPSPEYGPHPHFTLEAQRLADAYAWGEAFTQMGDRQRALQAYAKLDRKFLHLFRSDAKWLLVVRSWYERGRLYEQLRDTARAVSFYQKFVEAWRDADPPLQPMVRDAKAGLARLGRPHRD